jgi:hypothetical protein
MQLGVERRGVLRLIACPPPGRTARRAPRIPAARASLSGTPVTWSCSPARTSTGRSIRATSAEWSVAAIMVAALPYPAGRTWDMVATTRSLISAGACGARRFGPRNCAYARLPRAARSSIRRSMATRPASVRPDPRDDAARVSDRSTSGWRRAIRVAITPPHDTPTRCAWSCPSLLSSSTTARAYRSAGSAVASTPTGSSESP